MEDLERAVAVCYDDRVAPAIRAQATAYLEQLKEAPDMWRQCLEHFAAGTVASPFVRFFCLQAIEDCVRNRYDALLEADQRLLRDTWTTWIREGGAAGQPTYILNKAAQVLVLLLLRNFPAHWPNIFSDLVLSLTTGGTSAVGMFLRILDALSEDVIARNIGTTDALQARANDLKDCMRVMCIAEIAQTWPEIIAAFRRSEPDLVAMCFRVVGAYVEWVDIGLVVNDRLMPLVFEAFGDQSLREAAAECLLRIVEKGMDVPAKTRLVDSLGVAALVASALDTAVAQDNVEYAKTLSKIANVAGMALVDALNGREATTAETRARATELLQSQYVPLLVRVLGHASDDVTDASLGFASAYVKLLKNARESLPPEPPGFRELLRVIMHKMRYSMEHDFADDAGEVKQFADFRSSLSSLLAQMAHVNGPLVLDIVSAIVMSALQNALRLPFNDVEAALYLLYSMGDVFSAEFNSQRPSPLRTMAEAMVASDIASHPHFSVATQYFECAVRYAKFFESSPESIARILATFLDRRGIGHVNGTVRARAAYLFGRFARHFKAQLVPHLEVILRALNPAFTVVAGDDENKRMGVPFEDRCALIEGVAQVIGAEQLAPADQQRIVSSLMGPLVLEFSTILERRLYATDTEYQAPYATAMAQIVRIVYHFSVLLSPRSRGTAATFSSAMELFARGLVVTAGRDLVHAAVRQYLKRLISGLGEQVLPLVPPVSSALLAGFSPRYIMDFVPVVEQLAQTFKVKVATFVNEAVAVLVPCFFREFATKYDTTDSEAVAERKTLRRTFYQMVYTVVNYDLADVLASEANAPNLNSVLMIVVDAAESGDDVSIQKMCFGVLRRLFLLWGDRTDIPGFRGFVYEHVMRACFNAPFRPTFNMADQQTRLLLAEIAATQMDILKKCGAEFTQYLETVFFPSLRMNGDFARAYISAMGSQTGNEFRDTIKRLVEQSQR